MNRYEIKFDITKYPQNKIIRDYKLINLHPNRIINSIYFDTLDYDYYRDSEEGQTPRKKIRIRSYNKSKDYSLELKYTNSYHRKKIVINNFNYSNKNLLKKIKEFNINELVHPTLSVTYNRQYFSSSIGRITIDKNIIYQKVNNYLKISSAFIRDHKTILEVKVQKEDFDKNEIFEFFNFQESRNSKYCNGINIFHKKDY